MKTLDEVINALEKCMADDAIESEGVYLAADALHYLKKYRDNYEVRNDQIERYQKAAKECEEILTDYVALKQYWAEQQTNPPLTWDELKSMKGKPVWMEELHNGSRWYGFWDVISDAVDYGDEKTVYTKSEMRYEMAEYDKTWQAYRKERK